MQVEAHETTEPLPEVSSKLLSSPIIDVRNVYMRFGKSNPVLKNLSFQVERGQIFCLLGPSGSGKSTTMRLLTGVYQPSEGDVQVFNIAPSKFTRKIRKSIGYMPQHFVLFPELSTLDNINFVASAYGISWFERAKKIQAALEFVDLWEARKRLVSQLSGGMRRRLDLASALLHQPALIFVDEPTAGIDPILRAKFWEHFKALRDQGRTLFVTTQYVTEAEYCDKVAILNRGRLLALGTPEEVRQEAIGGEIINLTLKEVSSSALRLLNSLPIIQNIQPLSTEKVRLTVENASDALKLIIPSFNRKRINILNIEQYRPDFEEVFVRLMERDVKDKEDDAEKELL